MIIITGAAGFIGSSFSHFLSKTEKGRLVLVDQLGTQNKWRNLLGINNYEFWDREELFDILHEISEKPKFIVHLGACTDTAETDVNYLMKWNYQYTRNLWDYCTLNKIPFLYASSAATYGNGDEGYSDEHSVVSGLKPMNPYGFSKQAFDIFSTQETKTPPVWYGIKFFNVFGFGEFHKGNMASVAFHGFNQIEDTGELKLFRSHKEGVADGEQKRDFVYVKDAHRIMKFLMSGKAPSGLYNCGSGKAETFLALADALFAAMDKPKRIKWIDTPVEVRSSYQYFTQAEMGKIKKAGFAEPMTSLKDAVQDYVRELKLGKRT